MKPSLPSLATLLLTAALTGASAQTAPTTPAAPAQTAPAAPAKPVPASSYVALGDMYFNQGKYDMAYVAYRAAAQLEAQNPRALLGLGRSQTKLRLYGPAIETLRRLISVDATSISGYIALSQAYQQQYVQTSDLASVARNLELAQNVLTQAQTVAQSQTGTDRDLNLSKIWNERGYVYRLQGQITQAIEAFKQANTLNPDNSVVLYNLGDMYYVSGDLPQALNYLQQAVIADPADPYNRAYYGKLLALSGNVTAARPEAAQAAKLAPTNAYAVGQYGVVSYLAKDPVQARTQLNAALRLDPLRYPEFYYYLGRLNLDANDLKAARDALTRAAALGSTNPEYLYYLGLSFERSNTVSPSDRVKARENYERALKLSPNYKLAQDGLNRVK